MATIEELRKGVVSLVTMPSIITGDPIDTEAVRLVDSLMAAVEAQGVEKGTAQERHKWEAETLKALLFPDVSIADKLKAAADDILFNDPPDEEKL